MPAGILFGAHESIQGGVHRAVGIAEEVGCTALQIFLRPNQNWRAPALVDEEVARFRRALQRSSVRIVVAHSTYLANLGSPDRALWRRSLAVVADELERGRRLGVTHLVLHPGAHVGSGEEAALARIARAIDVLVDGAPDGAPAVTLEVTAGQGTCVGHRFWHLAEILERVRRPEALAFCLDTCHLLAAGYEVRDPVGAEETLSSFDRWVGLERVEVVHANDSRRGLGSRVDRHAGIGEGEIGEAGFRVLLAHPRLRRLPWILETPKGDDTIAADRANLARLLACLPEEN